MRIGSKTLLIVFAGLVFAVGCTTAAPTPGAISPTVAVLPAVTASPTATSTSPAPIAPTETPTPTAVPATATPDVPTEAVTFTTEDGVQIAATLFGDGDLAVIMLHMGKGQATGNNQQDWHPLARRLAERGYTALALDFRGRGQSGGEFANDPVVLDARAGLEFLCQRGFSRHVCLGAGVGGTTCMVLALTEQLEGLIVLSSTLAAGPTNMVAETDLAKISMPKLFIYGENDAFGFPEAMEGIYRQAAPPKELVTCDSAAHGSDLLYGSCGEDIHQQIFTFIQDIE